MRRFATVSYIIIAVSAAIMVTCFYLLYQMPTKQSRADLPLDDSRDIIIYTKSGCPYCVWAKDLLDEKRIAYKEVDMTGDEQRHYNMYLETGQRTVPYIYVDGMLIGGYDDLTKVSEKW